MLKFTLHDEIPRAILYGVFNAMIAVVLKFSVDMTNLHKFGAYMFNMQRRLIDIWNK